MTTTTTKPKDQTVSQVAETFVCNPQTELERFSHSTTRFIAVPASTIFRVYRR